MSNTAIRCEKIGKQYEIGERALYPPLLRDVLANAVTAPVRMFRKNGKNGASGHRSRERETIWALRDVSLEIREGEATGLIGANGAGKSTLLKILARVTRPTTGHAVIHGRIGSLLEVGTGFHHELTGRENCYLSGAILGMSKREITRKFDEIVAFAEVEKFIDTPIKHYSSGMQLRLAFAVAAHLEPEILLVDEVLAVGDINFQKKCIGKMGEVNKQGRTIVLVSHHLNQVRRLCHSVAWLQGGTLRDLGPTHDVVSAYEYFMQPGTPGLENRAAGDRAKARFIGWQLESDEGVDQGRGRRLTSLGKVKVSFHVDVRQPLDHIHHGIALYNSERQLIWGTSTDNLKFEPGQHKLTYEFESLPLRPGAYSWLLSLFDDEEEEIHMWEGEPEMIVATPSFQNHRYDEWIGVLNVRSNLQVSQDGNAERLLGPVESSERMSQIRPHE